MKLRLDFQSPVILGGRKTATNYIESIDYIQGNVLRAALAKYILNNCIEFNENETVDVNGVNKKNWVYYRDREGCQSCKLKGLCKKFSSLKFSYFYPEGADILPLTAMVCKLDESHGYIDLLTHKRECTICGKEGRVEAATGYIKDNKKYNVKKMFLTKTEIDNYTRTARDGRLYSVVAVSETSDNRNSFTGYIYGLDKEDLENIKELRVGKYVSVGYGKCTIEPICEENKDRQDMLQQLESFNNRYKSLSFNNADEKFNYFAIKLTSDAMLDVNIDSSKYMSTEEYIKLWQDVLKIDKKYQICKMYCESFNFRGFDLSKTGTDIREEPVVMMEKGSVILFKTQESLVNVLDYFEKLEGLGEENENGFGDFVFYFGGVSK
ncbi:MAG: hypothetical protein GX892_03715 [Thermoanaerobacteraceae bacterium]|nr:hypothetical protein [Thermoanaerobacteraceae bacterium]